MRYFLLVVGMALASAGCIQISAGDRPNIQVFSMLGPEPNHDAVVEAAPVLSVAEPRGAVIALGREIIWRRGERLGAMENAVWSEPARTLIQSVIVRTLSDRSEFGGVVRVGATVRSEIEIQVDVARLEVVETDEDLAAYAALQVTLVDVRSRQMVATRWVEGRRPIAERRASVAAPALAAAVQDAATQISDLAVRTVQARDLVQGK